MAIFQRFATLVRSNVNHWIGRAEDPEKMLNQMLLDMQEQLIEAKRQVAISIADEKRLAKHYQHETNLAQEWEEKAMVAVNAGSDELAQKALERKAEHEKMANGFRDQWMAQKQAVEKLKGALVTLSSKIEDAKRKKNLLVARAKRAEAERTIASTMNGISNTSALDTINRMEEKIDRMEAEASATAELAGELEKDELAAQFDKLKLSSPSSSNALAELKAKMGVKTVHALPPKQDHQLQSIAQEIEQEIANKK